ncbi:MAG: pyridoxal-phosphate dependent enzyme [Acidobacteria bacterium]|nr:pyridoxal-phosphate dependent enzyme [Acidobacteriota bacterium]
MTRPSAADFAAARQRIATRLQPSPLVESAWLSRVLGIPVWLKLETLQPTRSFKVRGAVNAVERLVSSRAHDAASTAQGRQPEPLRLVTASAGNHGAALAWAASQAGLPCTVVTPASAPRAKRDAISRLGADLRAIADDYDDAEGRALELAVEPGRVYVSPYNHPDVIAGAGTVGLEILQQKPDVGAIVVPLGGGGLLAGIALAVEPHRPRVAVVGVEAERSPAFSTSLAAGRIVPIEVGDTLADGLAGNLEAGSVTFDIIRDRAPQVVALSEADIGAGIVDLVAEERLVAEGAGVMAVAAIAAGRVPIDRGPVVAIVSGANIDIGVLATLLGPRAGLV